MKRFLSILLALVMVLSLMACGNKTTLDTPDTPDKQEETIHIGIVTGSVSQSEDDRRGAAAFQQLYGEGNVTLVTYPDNFTEELETTIQCMSSKITSTISVQLMPLYKSPHIYNERSLLRSCIDRPRRECYHKHIKIIGREK